MSWIRSLVLPLLLVVGCSFTWQPTPMLIGDLIALNQEAHELYAACVEFPVYQPEKEGCDPVLLEETLYKVRYEAKIFIGGDIKQPHGYDIFLENTLIYFTIAVRNADEYSEAERIARQFFEVQKVSSGRALDLARFYWVVMLLENLTFQINQGSLTLTEERKEEIDLCFAEGHKAVSNIQPAARKVYLIMALSALQMLVAEHG